MSRPIVVRRNDFFTCSQKRKWKSHQRARTKAINLSQRFLLCLFGQKARLVSFFCSLLLLSCRFIVRFRPTTPNTLAVWAGWWWSLIKINFAPKSRALDSNLARKLCLAHTQSFYPKFICCCCYCFSCASWLLFFVLSLAFTCIRLPTPATCVCKRETKIVPLSRCAMKWDASRWWNINKRFFFALTQRKKERKKMTTHRQLIWE